MTRAASFAAAILTAALACAPGATRADELRPHELAAKAPAMAAALGKVTPKAPGTEGWLSRLQGVASPLQPVEVNGTRMLSGYVCKPKDCRANRFVFLLSPDGSRAVSALRVTPDSGTAREVESGNPGLVEANELRRLLDR